ncbi:MAG TPA: cytidylate kinase-like family protein [Paludibacteraceae bacterium]|nr:cytidylate kinase-like family protein [Paludibacteraceae bacterium]HQF49772.1 cytidylate kinase-like family protein [Paludibacteraceae bacterium]HQJ90008.1 cytidylate kinase-like family protein [Paludibacteraceae bacterium]
MEKDKKIVITVNREAGSGGRTIGRIVAEKLGIKYYDNAVAEGLKAQFGVSIEDIEEFKLKKDIWMRLAHSLLDREEVDIPEKAQHTLTSENLFQAECTILKNIAKESCVIAGRLAHYVFRNDKDVIKIFITADKEKRVARFVKRQGLTSAEASKKIDELDNGREEYTIRYTKFTRYDARNYNLVLNVTNKTEEEAADLIISYIK